MSTQAMSRKRPAPDPSPPYQGLLDNSSYGAASSDLSNDQFLQWSENLQGDAQQNPHFNPDGIYPTTGYTGNVNVPSANQLMRSAPNQLVARSRGINDNTSGQWIQDSHGNSGGNEDEVLEKDDLPRLQAHALEAKKEAQAKRKQIPPFVQKLSSFLDQSKNTDLIRWSDDGKSFIVLDEDEFAKTLIPELFKHNNYASFVRQLNMYGFHKKVGLADNSMRASERKNKSPSEYSHDYFRRGHPELLWAIQKPKNTATGSKAKGRGSRGEIDGGDLDDNNDDYIEEIPSSVQAPMQRLAIEQAGGPPSPNTQMIARLVQQELITIRNQQNEIKGIIRELKQEHQALHHQALTFQEQHARHENSINAILTFLATVYNKSMQDGTNLNSFFGSGISQDSNQGNVVDVGDFAFDQDSPNEAMQRAFKKQPLLLKAPPAMTEASSGRASTLSPSNASSPYEGRQTRQMSQTFRNHNQPTSQIEEMYEPEPVPTNRPISQLSQRDIMSVIQNINRNSVPGTPASDFPTVINSLENIGGNNPLTASQRADMLRMINNSTNPGGNSNNALVTPTPPSMPSNYDARLANTQVEIDRLARMQAEQDQSVQNLERLLQPLSPNGSIPGIAGDQEVQIPPGLDLDEIFKTSDYFSGADPSMFDTKTMDADQNNGLNSEPYADDDLFGNTDTTGFGGQYKIDNDPEGTGGRVESIASSDDTTPANTLDNTGYQTRARAANINPTDADSSPVKKRRKNNT